MTTAQVSYIGNRVRQVWHEGSEWFVLADVCWALRLSKTESLLAVESEDLGLAYTAGWESVVSLRGALVLVALSDVPEAREFTRRVLAGES